MTSPSRLGTIACSGCNAHGSIGSRNPEAPEYECPECKGSRVKTCEVCGEREAVALTTNNSAACFECWMEDRWQQRKAGVVAFAEVSKGAVAARAQSSRAATLERRE